MTRSISNNKTRQPKRTNRTERSAHHRAAPRRRGSVLVLVMTILSVLFVVGVAFLATMNFEADTIAAERVARRNREGIRNITADLTQPLREALVTSVFTGSLSGDPTTFAAGVDLPGWHNLAAPIEPIVQFPLDANPLNHNLRWPWYTDLAKLFDGDGTGPAVGTPANFLLNPRIPNGLGLCVSLDATDGQPCVPNGNDPMCSGVCVNQTLETAPLDGVPDFGAHLDADGDGLADSFGFDARRLGLSQEFIERLSLAVNGRADGNVYIGMRIIPHGGLVNINDAHPFTIAGLFGFDPYKDGLPGNSQWPPRGKPIDLDQPLRGFFHRPTQEGTLYNPAIEEPILRRRGSLLPPRNLNSSLFSTDGFNGDLDGQLLHPIDTGTPPLLENMPPANERHRYWMYDPNEPSGNFPNALLWGTRMESEYARFLAPDTIDGPETIEFDRRHLLTTVSHDDNFHRGARWTDPDTGVELDVIETMRAANRNDTYDTTGFGPTSCDFAPLFEAPLYPFDLAGTPEANNPQQILNNCCPTHPQGNCKVDPRKGRLKLSIPYLDVLTSAGLADDLGNPVLNQDRPRDRLIYEYFWMLVSNATGLYWDVQDPNDETVEVDQCAGDINCRPGPYVCRDHDLDAATLMRCVDPTTSSADIVPTRHEFRREAIVSRVAASLTANMIDFADADDIPTPIQLRSFNLGEADDDFALVAFPEVLPGQPVFNDQGEPVLVYGKERQPYITEVAAAYDAGGDLTALGIELFNPYDADIDLDEYTLVILDDDTPVVDLALASNIDLTGPGVLIGAGDYAGFLSAGGALGTIDPTNQIYPTITPLVFDQGDTIYLVREIDLNGDTVIDPAERIVVDQFLVDGINTAVAGTGLGEPPPGDDPGDGDGFVATIQRGVNVATGAIWDCTVPHDGPAAEIALPEAMNPATIRADNPAGIVPPVELPIPNSGSFAAAFPSTGSLLLLLRHADRSLVDYDADGDFATPAATRELAANAWLNHQLFEIVTTDGGPQTAFLFERTAIDNGRMPIFDIGVAISGAPEAGQRHAHHYPAFADPDSLRTDATAATVMNTLNQPGRIQHLPWGQLVFDYFTALPLDNRGSYRVNHPLVADFEADPSMDGPGVRENAIPRVDQSGARVHGRIDLNSAPYSVLENVPYIAPNRLPASIRAKIEPLVQPGMTDPMDWKAGWVERDLSRAIVAYREARSVPDVMTGNNVTGDYGTTAGGATFTRAWGANYSDNLLIGDPADDNPYPTVRRGTGFLTVGELANVRFEDPDMPVDPAFRIDAGNVDEPAADQDFITAAARLIALSDWVTVRSHVYTVYGVVRGEVDPDLVATPEKQRRDLDGRTIRFQQTIDRMPMLLGASEPENVTPEVIERYNDVVNN